MNIKGVVQSSHASHVTVLIDGESDREHHLPPGDAVSFGSCGPECCDPAITTRGASGILSNSTEFAVLVANTSRQIPLHVWNTHDLDQRFVIPPSQNYTAVPFAEAGISGSAGHVLTVRAEPCDTLTSTCGTSDPHPLDPASRRYALLYYLATPILHGQPHPAARREVARRLGISTRVVDREINNLIDALAIPTPPEPLQGGWKTRAVVDAAISRSLLAAMPTWPVLEASTTRTSGVATPQLRRSPHHPEVTAR